MTTENLETDAFTPEEQAYLENQGVMPESEEAPALEEAGIEEETASEAVTTEEAGDDQPEEGDSEPKKSDMVPHGAFHAKNEELKRVKAELQDFKTKVAIVEDRFKRFDEMQSARNQPEHDDQPPGDDYPFGKIAWLEKQFQSMRQQEQQQQQLTQQQQQIADFRQAVQIEEQQFAREVPDYTEASKFLGQRIYNELAARGLEGPTLQKRYENELMTLALDAKESGRSVPEVVYNLATQWGYAKAEPAPDPAIEKQAEAKETLEKIAEGQSANKNPGAAGSGSGGRMTLEKFASMSEAESFAWMEKNPGGYEKLLRG